MAYVVADGCVKCKYTKCVEFCPVEAFHEGVNSLVINSEECIECGACEPECPISAIFEEGDLPEEWTAYTTINSVFSGALEIGEVDTEGWPEHLIEAANASDFKPWPIITVPKPEMDNAEEFKDDKEKLAEFDPAPGEGD